jgi:hypothetical protein
MDGSLFYWLGGALVLAALGIAAIGIRGRASFPPNRAVLVLGTAAFAAIVSGTTAFAVVNAQDEQEHRDKELAEEEATAEQEAPPPAPGGQPQPAGGGSGQPPQLRRPPPPWTTSPADGSWFSTQMASRAKAGSLTIAS